MASIQQLIMVLLLTICGPKAIGSPFDITELPKGKSVTLPHPATTVIPLPSTVILNSTDKDQTLKIIAVGKANGLAQPFDIAIFDSNSDRVRYITVREDSPVLYSFKSLGSIRLEAKFPSGRDDLAESTKLLVESNRPLGISH